MRGGGVSAWRPAASSIGMSETTGASGQPAPPRRRRGGARRLLAPARVPMKAVTRLSPSAEAVSASGAAGASASGTGELCSSARCHRPDGEAAGDPLPVGAHDDQHAPRVPWRTSIRTSASEGPERASTVAGIPSGPCQGFLGPFLDGFAQVVSVLWVPPLYTALERRVLRADRLPGPARCHPSVPRQPRPQRNASRPVRRRCSRRRSARPTLSRMSGVRQRDGAVVGRVACGSVQRGDDKRRGAAAHADRAVHVLVALAGQVRGGPVDRAGGDVLVRAEAEEPAQIVAGGVRAAGPLLRAEVRR